MNQSYIEIQTEPELEDGDRIINAMIKDVDLAVTGHFGNNVSLLLELEDADHASGYFRAMCNDTMIIGYLVKALMDALMPETDDSVPWTSLRRSSVRVVVSHGKYKAIGHFLEDKWLTEAAINEWWNRFNKNNN